MNETVMTISQYDNLDNEIAQYTGTFTSIFNSIPDFHKFYYRVTALGKKDVRGRVSTNHFGVMTTSIGGFNVTEESFINSFLNHLVKVYHEQRIYGELQIKAPDFYYLIIHDFWFEDQIKTLQQNTSQNFNSALNAFLANNPIFTPIKDLNELREKGGLYLLILDKYNVCYFGQSDDIRKRIMRHWSRNDYFYGTGIDMFKAKDTTRIYAAILPWHKINSYEHRAIKEMPSRYTLNCLAGGDLDFLSQNKMALLKERCSDSEFINYRKQYNYNIDRISKNIARFICNPHFAGMDPEKNSEESGSKTRTENLMCRKNYNM